MSFTPTCHPALRARTTAICHVMNFVCFSVIDVMDCKMNVVLQPTRSHLTSVSVVLVIMAGSSSGPR